MTVAVVDSGICNLTGVRRALERAGADVRVAETPGALAAADKVVLPGVGSFPAGMKSLAERGFDDAIRAHVAAGKPLLGICLGMQLLFETGSEFGETPGLGLIPGRVRELRCPGLALPHMGWNLLEPAVADDPLLQGLPGEPWFYFVHSFVCEPAEESAILARTEYGERFCSAVRSGNVWGLQAHPEKSQHTGAKVLENFVASEREA